MPSVGYGWFKTNQVEFAASVLNMSFPSEMMLGQRYAMGLDSRKHVASLSYLQQSTHRQY